MKPHLWPNDGFNTVDIEWISEDGRFLLWFDEDGEAGWAIVTKPEVEIIDSGYIPEKMLNAIYEWLKRFKEEEVDETQ